MIQAKMAAMADLQVANANEANGHLANLNRSIDVQWLPVSTASAGSRTTASHGMAEREVIYKAENHDTTLHQETD